MGCHTWFSRPITEEEFNIMKDYAPTEIYDLTIGSKESINSDAYDKYLYDILMKSYNENVPCFDGLYWWQCGWGSQAPKLDTLFIYYISKLKGLYVEVGEYTDTFRVDNYPNKIIRSRRELRRWIGKKYFDLTDEQLETISKFFREYPGGVITFG